MSVQTSVALQRDWLGLSQRVCVVTGAGSGIGAAIAEGLAEVGAQVALVDRDLPAAEAICPGMIRTALSAKFYEEPGFEEARAAVTASRRVGEPIDIANPAIFLASDRAAYLNGAEVLVDGGLGCMLMDMVPRPGFNTAQSNAPSRA
jgi:NAD(P)-dependent dehydrogenase (short-subunit alcohol dehydrogenase family)